MMRLGKNVKIRFMLLCAILIVMLQGIGFYANDKRSSDSLKQEIFSSLDAIAQGKAQVIQAFIKEVKEHKELLAQNFITNEHLNSFKK